MMRMSGVALLPTRKRKADKLDADYKDNSESSLTEASSKQEDVNVRSRVRAGKNKAKTGTKTVTATKTTKKPATRTGKVRSLYKGRNKKAWTGSWPKSSEEEDNEDPEAGVHSPAPPYQATTPPSPAYGAAPEYPSATTAVVVAAARADPDDPWPGTDQHTGHSFLERGDTEHAPSHRRHLSQWRPPL